VKITAINGSMTAGGNTRILIEAILDGAGDRDAELVELAGSATTTVQAAASAIHSANAVVFASPIYRASIGAPLKTLLERLPRGMHGEAAAPLQGRAVAIAATGSTLHHYLALNELRNVLAGFFCAHVVPPGVYVPSEGFDEGRLAEPYVGFARTQGQALAELAAVLDASTFLKELRPQA
jgi:FMN reductase